MAEMAFALVLNLHQPAGNLEDLLGQREWEAREILWAMDRIPRSLRAYDDVGRVHLSLSGTLLETLASPGFQHRAYGIVDCVSLLWCLQNTNIIRILGTGYYHPVLPLIPRADWDATGSRRVSGEGPGLVSADGLVSLASLAGGRWRRRSPTRRR